MYKIYELTKTKIRNKKEYDIRNAIEYPEIYETKKSANEALNRRFEKLIELIKRESPFETVEKTEVYMKNGKLAQIKIYPYDDKKKNIRLIFIDDENNTELSKLWKKWTNINFDYEKNVLKTETLFDTNKIKYIAIGEKLTHNVLYVPETEKNIMQYIKKKHKDINKWTAEQVEWHVDEYDEPYIKEIFDANNYIDLELPFR